MKRVGLATLLLFDAIAFGPLLLGGRVYSSQGWIRAHDPWRGTPAAARPEQIQPLLADAADANAPALRRLRQRPAGFFWNPWVSSGVPGTFELAQGLLSPFAWLPALLLPEAGVETGILFLKTQFAFLAMWLFLRRRQFAPAPAALGAAAWAFSTGQTVWGLFMQSSVSVTYPLLLLGVDLALRAPARRALAFGAASVLLFLTGGFPHWLAYGALAAAVYFLFQAWARPRRAARAALVMAAASAIAVAALLPSILAAARVVSRAGYGELRAHLGTAAPPLPTAHLALYAFPSLRGTPGSGDWRPLGWIPGENYIETAVGIGPVAAGLALVGIFSRRRGRLALFCGALALAIALPLYGGGRPARLLGSLPPFDTALLARMKILIVLALAIAAACGLEALSRARPAIRRLAALAPLSTAVALAPMLAAFTPATTPADAVFVTTPGIERLARRLREDGGRFAAVGWILPPNVAQAFALEDVRGHFFHEASYRRFLSAADRALFGENGTYLIFDPRSFDARSPVLDRLSVTTLALPPGAPAPEGTSEFYRGEDWTLAARPAAHSRFRLEAGDEPLATAALEVLAREPGSFRVRVEIDHPARLKTSEKRWDPYWTLRLDGRSVPAATGEELFLVMDVPAGRHVVDGRFRIPPVELAIGALGGISLLLVVARGLLPLRRRATEARIGDRRS